jgi:hypothetical protein
LLSSGFGADSDAFVTTLYVQILGQNPDQAVLSHWSGLLFAGMSPLTVVRKLWKSPAQHALQTMGLDPPISFRRAYHDALQAGRQAQRMHAAARAH